MCAIFIGIAMNRYKGEKYMLKIGSHVGMSGKEMLLGSAKEAKSYGANVFMVYTGAPQNTRRKDVSELRIDEAHEYMKVNGIEDHHVKWNKTDSERSHYFCLSGGSGRNKCLPKYSKS